MIIPINPSSSLVNEDGAATTLFRDFILQVSEESMAIGSGSPEGLLEASKGKRYMDEDGTTGSILYIKKLESISGDRSQGWILV